MRPWPLILAWCVAAVLNCPDQASAVDAGRPAIGTTVKELRFKDIRYLPRTLHEFGEQRAFVIVLTNTSCPLVQKYWPKLKRLDEEFRSQQVQFLAVNASAGDEIGDVAQQAIDFGIEFPLVKDTDGSCVKTLGVERTPECVILDSQRRIRYRGRIDNQYRLGGSRPDVTEDDLVRALKDVLQGREVTPSETAVDGCRITLPTPPKQDSLVTFHEHIAPLLQQHCQECHHPGGGAPFSLVTLDDATSHAEMLAEVVGDRRMPPWHANPKQHFWNERVLTAEQRDQFVAWVTTGRAAGDAAKAPAPLNSTKTKWAIGKPDLVTTSILPHQLPAEGFIDYRYVVLPCIFTEDTWISACEILPSNPATVHHCNMAYVTIGEDYNEKNFITGRVPGGTAMVLDEGVAFLNKQKDFEQG